MAIVCNLSIICNSVLCLVVTLLCLITCLITCYVTCTLQAGESPLHRAAFHGRTELVKMLLAAGVPVNIKNNVSMCC